MLNYLIANLYYVIGSARESKCINHMVISTDSEEIADVAKNYGVDDIIMPFIMDKTESIAVNTSLDFQFAEIVTKKRKTR
jgi:CMP-N-acetylneuraminic acid synthetase